MAIDTTPRTPGSSAPPQRAPAAGDRGDGTGPVTALRQARPVTALRQARPVTAPRQARPVTAPRHTRPVTRPATAPGTRQAAPRPPRARSPRMPFILLLVALLGGALVCLLVISTTLAQGGFQITMLQEQNASLARQQQILTDEVAQAANPAVIAGEAERLGMRPNPYLGFVDLKTGKIVAGKPSAAEAAISVPGYTP